jgi:hypothetical protein
MKRIFIGVTLVAGAIVSGCSHGRTLIVQRADLLEKPYPLAYPGVGANRVLARLVDTNVCVLDDSYGKDFHVYRVRTATGQTGFVVQTSTVTETDSPCD